MSAAICTSFQDILIFVISTKSDATLFKFTHQVCTTVIRLMIVICQTIIFFSFVDNLNDMSDSKITVKMII